MLFFPQMENHLSPTNGDCEAVERSCQFQQIGCCAREVCVKYLVYSFQSFQSETFNSLTWLTTAISAALGVAVGLE